jgi:hypothetical protein
MDVSSWTLPSKCEITRAAYVSSSMHPRAPTERGSSGHVILILSMGHKCSSDPCPGQVGHSWWDS